MTSRTYAKYAKDGREKDLWTNIANMTIINSKMDLRGLQQVIVTLVFAPTVVCKETLFTTVTISFIFAQAFCVMV